MGPHDTRQSDDAGRFIPGSDTQEMLLPNATARRLRLRTRTGGCLGPPQVSVLSDRRLQQTVTSVRSVDQTQVNGGTTEHRCSREHEPGAPLRTDAPLHPGNILPQRRNMMTHLTAERLSGLPPPFRLPVRGFIRRFSSWWSRNLSQKEVSQSHDHQSTSDGHRTADMMRRSTD